MWFGDRCVMARGRCRVRRTVADGWRGGRVERPEDVPAVDAGGDLLRRARILSTAGRGVVAVVISPEPVKT